MQTLAGHKWYPSKRAELLDALYDIVEAATSAMCTDPFPDGWEIALLRTRLERVEEIHQKEDYVSDPDSEPLGN